jgi:stage III sporulation protein AB
LEGYRAEDLREFRKALDILRAEIRFACAPLPEAAAGIASKIAAPVGGVFETFARLLAEGGAASAYEAWDEALAARGSATYLKPEDFDCLDAFGKTLGYLDKGMQLNSIDRAIAYIDATTERLDAAGEKSAKLYRSLGVLGGLLAVMMFIV